MGKEFIEYQNEKGTIPYGASKICFSLTAYAKKYIFSERNLISEVDPKVRDAVLVDSINFLGIQGGIDFGLVTDHLYDGKTEVAEVDAQSILTALPNHYAYYIFNEGIVESVLRNNHMNECTEKFDQNDGVLVLLDFINFIAKENDYDRIFTIDELYNRAEIQNYNRDIKQLKKFLEQTSDYGERLQDGENIDSIFNEMAEEHNLKSISKRGVYYYTDEIKERVGQSQMFSWTKNDVETEIYAMAYAYSKLGLDKQETPKTEIIRQKIKEMKKRSN